MQENFFLLLLGLALAQEPVPFNVPFYGETSGGFKSAARGWNSWAMQANPAVAPSFQFNQEQVLRQCLNLRAIPGHDTYCSLDSGWSHGSDGDEYGRLVPNITAFPNITRLAEQLHVNGLKLGVYVLPGAFNNDVDKTVLGTNIKVGDLFNRTDDPSGETCNNYLARNNFDFTKEGVREWHEAVINLFAEWGVDFIKLDFVTPGSPQGGCLPYDSSESARFYRDAIKKNGRPIRLHLSWKLDRSSPYWEVWKENADSLRTDQDINNADQRQFVSWEVVQRAINHYRLFIVDQIKDEGRHGLPINIRPDMDNSVFANAEGVSGLNDGQRYTMAMHWIGAGANLITGSDMSRIDELGEELMWNDEAMEVANFCSEYPMQPRNPQGAERPGGYEAMQFQTWISGPSADGEAVVIQSNYGPDLGQGGFGTGFRGRHNVNISMANLGIGEGMREGGKIWSVRRVWGVGEDHTGPWNVSGQGELETWLGEGESVLYHLKRVE